MFAASCVVIAVVAPMPYLTTSWAELAASDAGLAKHYAAQPFAIRMSLIIHAAAAGIALLLVPVQASHRLRRRVPLVHRMSGRVSMVMIAIGASFGLVIATVSYAGVIGIVGFSCLAVLWVVCATAAVRCARAGDLRRHREWATRTMALTFAAVTLRLWVAVLVVAQQPANDAEAALAFDRAYPWVPFLCWVPNLLIAEWLIRRRKPQVGPTRVSAKS
jgi:uncharacterized membrane protein